MLQHGKLLAARACRAAMPRTRQHVQVFKAPNQTKVLWIEHWKQLLDTCQVIGSHGVTASEARLLFVWGQSVVKDELKKRQRAVSLVLFDFVEARPCLPSRRAYVFCMWGSGAPSVNGRSCSHANALRALEAHRSLPFSTWSLCARVLKWLAHVTHCASGHLCKHITATGQHQPRMPLHALLRVGGC